MNATSKLFYNFHKELSDSAHLEDRPMFLLQCAMEENCLASKAYEIQRDSNDWHMETRRLLKFTARTLNAGSADFRPNIPKHLWEWHLCHQYVEQNNCEKWLVMILIVFINHHFFSLQALSQHGSVCHFPYLQ